MRREGYLAKARELPLKKIKLKPEKKKPKKQKKPKKPQKPNKPTGKKKHKCMCGHAKKKNNNKNTKRKKKIPLY